MEVVVTTGTISHAKLQSTRHHQQSNTHFLQAGCPSCHPTNSVTQSTGGILTRAELCYVHAGDRRLLRGDERGDDSSDWTARASRVNRELHRVGHQDHRERGLRPVPRRKRQAVVGRHGGLLAGGGTHHIAYIIRKPNSRLHFLRLVRRAAASEDIFYIGVVRPVLEYGVAGWHAGLAADLSDQLETIKKRTLRIIFGGSSFTSQSYEPFCYNLKIYHYLLAEINWLPVFLINS